MWSSSPRPASPTPRPTRRERRARQHSPQGRRCALVSAAGRARGALVDLHGRGATISFASVAARAHVSRQFLYSHPDLRAEIERLRSEPQPAPARQQASDESMRTRLRAALDDNKRLRQQIAELRDELALTHGRVRELELATRAVPRA